MPEKLLAEWFWVDRWMGSGGFLLPIDARGLYREMMSQAWRRGARLPNNHETIRRAVGVTQKEWARTWPLVERFWRVDGEYLVNDTQLDVYADAKARQEKATNRAKAGARAKHKKHSSTTQAHAQDGAQAVTQAPLKVTPPITVSDHQEEQKHTHTNARVPVALAGTLPRDFKTQAWISSRGKHVPHFLHEEFILAIGGTRESADQRLRTFYEAREHGWPPGPIGDDPVKLWRKEFEASFPSVAPVKAAASGGRTGHVPGKYSGISQRDE